MKRVEMVYPQASYTFTREETKAIWIAVSFYNESHSWADPDKEQEILARLEDFFSLVLKD